MSREKITTSFRLPKEDKEFLDDFAKKEGKSPSEILRTAIDLFKSCAMGVEPLSTDKGQVLFKMALEATNLAWSQSFKLKEADEVAEDAISYIECTLKEPISESDYQKLLCKGDFEWLFRVAEYETKSFFCSKGHLRNWIHPISLKLFGPEECLTKPNFAIYEEIKHSMSYVDFHNHLDQKISALTGVPDELYAETVKSMIDKLKKNCKTRRRPQLRNFKDPFRAWESHCYDLEQWRPYLQKFNIIEDLFLEIDCFSYSKLEDIYFNTKEHRPDLSYEILPQKEAERLIKQRKKIIEKLESIRFFKNINYNDWVKEALKELTDETSKNKNQ